MTTVETEEELTTTGVAKSHIEFNMPLRTWAVFGLLLFAVTWKLWMPQTVFPQVPLFAFLSAIPMFTQWLGTIGVLVGLILVVARGEAGLRKGALLFTPAVIWLFATDQHRLQPWTVQLLIFFTILALGHFDKGSWAQSIRRLRWIVISIYAYSALGKFDYQFIHTVGQDFLEAGCGLTSIDFAAISAETRANLAYVFPIAELLVALGLLLPLTRRTTAILAVVLHGSLLVILGPWGLNHHNGVLVWNIAFAAQTWFLFHYATSRYAVPKTDSPSNEQDSNGASPSRVRTLACQIVTLLVLIVPATEGFGWCDHWLAWGLYSPRNSRASVYIRDLGTNRLPTQLRTNLKSTNQPGWQKIRLDQWSLASLSVPIYPEDRFQLGVAIAISQELQLGNLLLVERQSMSDRWTGERKRKQLVGIDELTKALDNFTINAAPTENWAVSEH